MDYKRFYACGGTILMRAKEKKSPDEYSEWKLNYR